MKKISLLTVLLVLLLAANSFGQHFDRENDFRWVRIGSNVKIIKYIGHNTYVRIPSQIQGMLVTEIANGAFHACGLISVDIPDSVISIGDWAFSSNQLVRVTIGNRVTFIGYAAFFDNRITGINFPNGLMSIGDHAFNKNQLSIVEIPNSVTSIGYGAFANNRIISVVIGDRASSIGDLAFDNNPISNITFSGGIGVISGNVFAGSLRNLSRVIIGVNVNLRASSSADVVWEGFRNAYSSNGYRTGIYTLQNGRWSFQSN